MKKLITICAVVVTILAISGAAQAATLVDRGLPITNLNHAALPTGNMSNVGWAPAWPIGEMPASNIMLGDDFTLPTAAGQYHVANIRIWMDSPYNLADYTGTARPDPPDGSNITGGTSKPFADMFNSISLDLRQGTSGSFTVIGSPTITQVTYVNGQGIQGGTGYYRPMYQLDFAVDITASGGTLFDFALNFDSKVDSINQWGYGNYLAFLLGSNKDLSGSPQEGSDNLYYDWDKTTGALLAIENSGGVDGGWDKSSDINVQVEGSVVPEPATMVLLSLAGLSSLAMVWIRRRRLSG
jgi:hypothetical protein